MAIAELLVALFVVVSLWALTSGLGPTRGGLALRTRPDRGWAPGGEGARWARSADLRALSFRSEEGGRLTLGRSMGRILSAEPGTSVLVVGPTQSRKTSGLAIPAVLEWSGPVVAASVKSDLARHTHDWRSSIGEVFVYDPVRCTPYVSMHWSPLHMAVTWSGARRAAGSLTGVARSSASGLSDGEFWYSTAAKLLAPLLHAAAISGRTMIDVVRWLDEQETTEVAEALEAGWALEALQSFRATCARDDRQRSAIYTTAETTVEAFADPEVAWSSGSADDSSILSQGSFLEGPNTLFVCAPAHEQRRLRPLFATLVTDVIERAFERAEREGRPLDPPLLVVLDEAANVAPLEELDVLASTAAGHGVQLLTVWQDLSQLNSRYGTRGSSIVNNHRAKVFLSGIADPHTLGHVSELAGEAEHVARSRTTDAQRGSSRTEAVVSRRLLPAHALRTIRPGEAVLLYGHLPPVRMSLRPWQDDRRLRQRVGAGNTHGPWPERRGGR